MKGEGQIKPQRFSFPTEALKVCKTKVKLTRWNFKDLRHITKDLSANVGRGSAGSACRENVASLGTILTEKFRVKERRFVRRAKCGFSKMPETNK